MKILWIDPDRSRQVVDTFYSLMMECGNHAELELQLMPMDRLEVEICIDSSHPKGKHINPPRMLDPEYVNTFDWVITSAVYAFLGEEWSAIKAKKAVLWGDQHGEMVQHYLRKAHDEFKFDLFLPLYRDATLQCHSYLEPEKIRWLPTWADTRYFKDWGLPKKYDVLLTGVIHPVVYPWRQEIFNTCKDEPWFTHIERPYDNYEGFDGLWPVKEEFGKVLNQTRIAPTDISRYSYVLGKVLEIPASKCVLACDFNGEMHSMGYVPWRNFIPLVNNSDIPKLFKEWLQRDDLEAIAQAGHDLIYQNHTDIIRARQLVQLLENY